MNWFLSPGLPFLGFGQLKSSPFSSSSMKLTLSPNEQNIVIQHGTDWDGARCLTFSNMHFDRAFLEQ